jgi:hypothetical protein
MVNNYLEIYTYYIKRGDNVENLNKDKNFGGGNLNNIDNLILDSYIPAGKDYPIIERTNNALLWPEEIKDGIDLNDTDTLTQVQVNPNSHPESIKE